jgi:hypothetical protein
MASFKAASLMIANLVKQAVTQTFTGTSLGLDRPIHNHTIQYSWAVTGEGADKAIAALVFNFEGSLDGTNWFILSTETADGTEITNKCGMFSVADKPIIYARAKVTTLTITGSTGTVTLTILHCGKE